MSKFIRHGKDHCEISVELVDQNQPTGVITLGLQISKKARPKYFFNGRSSNRKVRPSIVIGPQAEYFFRRVFSRACVAKCGGKCAHGKLRLHFFLRVLFFCSHCRPSHKRWKQTMELQVLSYR